MDFGEISIVDVIRRINLWLAGIGVVLFWALASLLLLVPRTFDTYAESFAISEVADRLGALQKNQALGTGAAGTLPESVRAHLPEELQRRLSSLERLSAPETEAFVRALLAGACKVECGASTRAGRHVSSVFLQLRTDLASAQERVRRFVLDQFDDVLVEVRRDVTVFAVTNVALFLAAFLLSVFRKHASPQLLPLSLALSTTTLFLGGWYLLGQDWFLTVIFSDYWGLTYPVFAAVLAFFLLDVAFFRARVTSSVINAVLSGVGSAFTVSPC